MMPRIHKTLKTYKEMAERMDQDFEAGREMDGYEPTELHVSRSAGASLTVRLSEEDFALLRRHAQAKGLNMSEFARDALMKAAAADSEDPLTELVACVNRLAKLARKIEVRRSAAGSALTMRPASTRASIRRRDARRITDG